MDFTDVEIRVLGCLIEKRATTPEQYPLSTNSLTTACNQKSSREPVMDLGERDVLTALMELRAAKLCRSVSSGRTDKHKHVLDEAWELSAKQLAALAIMLLRGPQTPGEIRTRTDRYVEFDSVGEVESTLLSLATRAEALVVDLGRGPGQSQNRWMHLLAGEPDAAAMAARVASSPSSAGPSRNSRVEELETKVQELEQRLTRLEAELGLSEQQLGHEPAGPPWP